MNDDLISRKALLEALEKECEGCEVFPYMVLNAPAVEAEPVRHGHWIRDGDWCNPRCSECGSYTDFYVAREYCPNCGAKMDGGNKSDC